MAKKKNTESTVPVALPTVMIHKDNLYFDEKNVQKQSRETFNKLMENIKEHGFDENLVVMPHPEKVNGYWVVSGNHKCKAGIKLGMVEFPCTVQETWTTTDAALQGVRRNYARGQLDKGAFTLLTDDLLEQGVALDAIQDGFGFGDDLDAFADLYQTQAEESVAKEEKEQTERHANDNAEKVRLVENLELIISHIYEEYGDSLTSSFLIFPANNRKHMYVQANNSLRNVITKIAGLTLAKGMDLNTTLAGLLTVGLHTSKFGEDVEKIKAGAEENITGEDSDFEKIEVV